MDKGAQWAERASLIPVLIELFVIGAREKPVRISTKELGARVGRSQQAVSRQLIELEKDGMVEIYRMGRRNAIQITEKGSSILQQLYVVLREGFEAAPVVIELRGKVFSGVKEGAYYISLKGYREQFIEKLGFDPYPGTLNIQLTSALNRRLKEEAEAYSGIEIQGFYDEFRTYGGAKCFPAVVNNEVEAAVVITKRSIYGKDVLELIAPCNLRERLNLKDGDHVTVKIYLSRKSIEGARASGAPSPRSSDTPLR